MFGPWREHIKFYALGDDWRNPTPSEILNGSFLLPTPFRIWKSFERLSRGRPVSAMGTPLPLAYRDIRDESERCICDLSAEQVENLIVLLDDGFLERCNKNGDSSRSGN